MTASKLDMKPTWTDPDDAPELTDEWFEGATLREGGTVRRMPGQRGRGKKPRKESITLRLDPIILEHFRKSGDGWQTRINDALMKMVPPSETGQRSFRRSREAEATDPLRKWDE